MAKKEVMQKTPYSACFDLDSTCNLGSFAVPVKNRIRVAGPVEVGHHSAIPRHLCTIAVLTGRRISWDAKMEKILDDAEVSKLLTRPYRSP